MSLAFLFKKTWHPSTLQNSERVWIAEQKDAAEKRRIEELTKRVREEHQVRELEEMQAAGGHAPERRERIDWMYEGPMQSAEEKQAEADEYLLGKEFKLPDKGTSDLKKLEESKAPGTLFTAGPATSANEAFRRVQEDPLLRMRKARMDAEQSIKDNPVKMGTIRQKLEAELSAKAARKRAKKEAKKAKKEAKKAKKREKKQQLKGRENQRPDGGRGHEDEGRRHRRDEVHASNAAAFRGRHDPRDRDDSRRSAYPGGVDPRQRHEVVPARSDRDRRRMGDSPDGARDRDRGEEDGHRRDERSGRNEYRRDRGRHSVGHMTDERNFRRDNDRSGARGDGYHRVEEDGARRRDRHTRAGENSSQRDEPRVRDRSERRGYREGYDRRARDRAEDLNDRRGRERGRGGGRDGDASRERERGKMPRQSRRDRARDEDRVTTGRDASEKRSRKRSRSRSSSRSSSSSSSSSSGGSDSGSGSGSGSSNGSSDGERPAARSTSASAAPADKRYGLLGDSSASSGARGGAPLGPATALLEAKEKERSERERAKADARRRRVMTPEEKLRRLREMEEDGARNQDIKKRRLEDGRQDDRRAEATDRAAGAEGVGSASFIEKMRGEQVDGMALEERMKRNRHYQQRGANVENFMTRG